jgi:LPPG:FO 2-phospho-L-lactate transferase
VARVVLLSGGTGGAKLARGFLEHGATELTVVANTGDDVEIHGGHVSPDPDLITFWLADRIDARGWGLDGDTFNVMDGLRELGEDVWFNLGDRDLALCVRRARRLAEGARLTGVLDEHRRAYGVPVPVLPMADEPVRTRVKARGAWHGLQEFLIRERGAGPVADVAYDGAERARPVPEALEAIAAADAIVLGPSNPVISIGPILAVPGMRDALAAARAPVLAVSPLVDGQVLKGPTAAFMAWAGQALDSDGIARIYSGVLDGLVADAPAASLPTRVTGVELGDPAARRSVVDAVLALAASLASRSATSAPVSAAE